MELGEINALIEERDRLRDDLERAIKLSVAGLCYFGADSKDRFLDDIRKIGVRYGADDLGSFPVEEGR